MKNESIFAYINYVAKLRRDKKLKMLECVEPPLSSFAHLEVCLRATEDISPRGDI